MTMRNKFTKSVLLIGGIDPTGHAGLYRDQEICRQSKTPCLSIPTALALQNDQKYWQTLPVPTKILQKILDDVDVKMIGAIKIGMLVNAEIVNIVIQFIRRIKKQNPKIKVVWDPVFASSSGGILLDRLGQKSAIQNLWPLVDLITPNAIEAQILGGKKESKNWPELAKRLYLKNNVAVYLKGGHTQKKATDYFYDGTPRVLSAPLSQIRLRGTGCTLATATACFLTKNTSLVEACFQAKNTMNQLFAKKNQKNRKNH